YSNNAGGRDGGSDIGSSGAIVFLNSDWENDHEVTVNTDIPDNTLLVDYTDHGISAVVRDGRITVKVPANREGRGYLVMAKPGIGGEFLPARSSVTQEWEGNADLGIRPADGQWRQVCRIWVDGGKIIRSRL